MKALALMTVIAAALSQPALAQSANNAGETAAPAAQPPAAGAQPVKRVAMRTLLASGYEIKAVTLVPQDVSSRVARALDVDAALVTLQKGSTAATCFLALDAYVGAGMLDISWCIEQK